MATYPGAARCAACRWRLDRCLGGKCAGWSNHDWWMQPRWRVSSWLRPRTQLTILAATCCQELSPHRRGRGPRGWCGQGAGSGWEVWCTRDTSLLPRHHPQCMEAKGTDRNIDHPPRTEPDDLVSRQGLAILAGRDASHRADSRLFCWTKAFGEWSAS